MGLGGRGLVARVELACPSPALCSAACPPPPTTPSATPRVPSTSSSEFASFQLEAPAHGAAATHAAHNPAVTGVNGNATAVNGDATAVNGDASAVNGDAPAGLHGSVGVFKAEQAPQPPHRVSSLDGSSDATGNTAPALEHPECRGGKEPEYRPRALPPAVARGTSAGGATAGGDGSLEESNFFTRQPPCGAHPPPSGFLQLSRGVSPAGAGTEPAPCSVAAGNGDGRPPCYGGDDERVSVLSLHESQLESFLAAAAGASTPPWPQHSLLKVLGGDPPPGGPASSRSVAAAARHRGESEETPAGEPTPLERLSIMSANSELMREVDGA